MKQLSNTPFSVSTYEVCVREDLGDDLASWFSPLTVAHTPDGTTTLAVQVRDQAELHGLLIKIRDLNLTLIAIVKV